MAALRRTWLVTPLSPATAVLTRSGLRRLDQVRTNVLRVVASQLWAAYRFESGTGTEGSRSNGGRLPSTYFTPIRKGDVMLGIFIVAVTELFRSDEDRQYHRQLERNREENAMHERERLEMKAENRRQQKRIDNGLSRQHSIRKPR